MGENWFCYLLESLYNPKLSYIGIATDVDRRLVEHNEREKGFGGQKQKGSWFTSFNGPWKLVQHVSGFKSSAQVAIEFRLKKDSKEPKW